jgi:DNA-binding NarL/FixJ family response regulator
VISVHAGAALHVLSKGDTAPEVVRSLSAIRRASNGALDELRLTLATFTGTVGGRSPAPGLDRVPELVASTNVDGLRVEYAVSGERGEVPAAVDLAGYRIVQEALTTIRATRPDVALMDVRMPVLDGIEALRRITADPQLRDCRVIVVTTFEFDEYVFEALRAGASGFLTKDAEPAELLRGIRVVAAGESLLSPAVTRRVIERFAGGAVPAATARRTTANLDSLTEREREIVGWVATGLSNDEIGRALVVSPATVRTHVGRALMKLGARDRAQLVVIAYQSGLPIPGIE